MTKLQHDRASAGSVMSRNLTQNLKKYIMPKKKIVVPLIALGGIAFTATASLADAFGVERWGSYSIPIPRVGTVDVPAGTLYHRIEGDGYYIDHEEAGFASIGNLCDASVRFTYGVHYSNPTASNGAIHRGCSHAGKWEYWPRGKKFPRGWACAELWINAWKGKVAAQCHFISD
jgi:hypothetical protein